MSGLEGAPKPPITQENEPHDIELREALEKVDFTRLREVCAEKLCSLGIDSSEMGFLEKDRIISLPKKNTFLARGGNFQSKNQVISLNLHYAKLSEKLSHGKKSAENNLLSILCHEESHALSFQNCGEWEKTKVPFFEKKEHRLGFRKQYEGRLTKALPIYPDPEFTMFNEGVTDLIGKELFSTYLEKTNTDSKDSSKPEYLNAYPTARLLVNTVIKKIALESGVDKEVVWKSLQRAYILGEDVEGDRMRRLFKEVAPNSLFRNVRDATGELSPSLLLAIMKIKLLPWSPKQKKRVRRWFELMERVMDNQG